MLYEVITLVLPSPLSQPRPDSSWPALAKKGGSSVITSYSIHYTKLYDFPARAYARAAAQLAVPLNLSFAAAPPVFAAILTAAGPHAALWLAFAISIFAFASLFGLFLLHRREERALQDAALPNADRT